MGGATAPTETPTDTPPAGGGEEPSMADKAAQSGRALGSGSMTSGSIGGLTAGAKGNAEAGAKALSDSARVNEAGTPSARDTVEKNNRSRLGGN